MFLSVLIIVFTLFSNSVLALTQAEKDFDLGVLEEKKGNLSEARRFLNKSCAGGFNQACHNRVKLNK